MPTFALQPAPAPRRPRRAEVEALARDAGLHPDLVVRFVRLGLVETRPQPPVFGPEAADALARAARLRRDLGLDYGGAVLACELLARIDRLEQRLRRYEG
jgi:hypothetical protein